MKTSELKIKMLFFNFLLLIVFVSICGASTTVDVGKALSTIPAKEKKMIENLFRFLVQRKSFGYTLFGSKPLTIECWSIKHQPMHLQEFSSIPKNIQLCYEVWENHKKKFPSKNFIFDNRIDNGIKEIYIINKEKISYVIKNNKDLFGKNFENVEKKISFYLSLNSINRKSHECLGVLLGFGRRNADTFQKMMDSALFNESLVPFSSLEKSSDLFLCKLPTFMVDSSLKQTHELYADYVKTREKLTKILIKENFLEIVLEKFCEKK